MEIFLPEQYSFAHDFCLYLHDYLANFIVYGEDVEAFQVEFDLESEEDAAELSGLEGIWVGEWLAEKGYTDILGELLLKTLFPALLADFCQFIYEALNCSQRARLTVAYVLLRKPLKENLTYLEWLLADPEGLLTTLYNEPASELALHKLVPRKRALNVIKDAVGRTVYSDVYDADFIYNLRFNKAAHYSFDQLWHKAVHLVTTHRLLETEPQNLNFIFSGDEARLSQWHHLYSFLPLLLFYAVDVCESLITMILRGPMPDAAQAIFHRSLGFMLWTHEASKWQGEHRLPQSSRILQEMSLQCPSCKRALPSSEEVIRGLFVNGAVKCPACKSRITIEKLIE
jgi:hypothetical protein